jgi:tight adherence protein B
VEPITFIVIFGAATIGLLFYGLSLVAGRRKAILAQRLQTYAGIEEEAALAADAELKGLSSIPGLFRSLFGRGYVQKIEDNLARADIPMRPTEYILLRLVLAGVCFLWGVYALGSLRGAILAIVGFLAPAFFVRFHQNRRRAKFISQLADALMLLTNSLRSGYGFLKGLELIAKEMDDPISKELNRMLREVNLGATIDQALLNLGKRINSQDMDIVISAYLVQKDVGGNLTEIMEKVAETIRERLRIQGDIRVLTAQGRFSGLVVGLLPTFLAIVFWFWLPEYFRPLVGPPMLPLWGHLELPLGVLLLAGALFWQIIGGYLIYRIINIRV